MCEYASGLQKASLSLTVSLGSSLLDLGKLFTMEGRRYLLEMTHLTSTERRITTYLNRRGNGSFRKDPVGLECRLQLADRVDSFLERPR